MSVAGEPLRPLSIGEIFDRAVTLYVRNFVLFSLILLVVLIPVELASLWLLGGGAYQNILQQATHPEGTPSAAVLGNILQMEGMVFLIVLLRGILAPFAAVAVAAAIGDLYREGRASFARAYAVPLQCWPGMLGTELMSGIIVGAFMLVGAFLLGGGLGIGIFATRGSGPALVVFFVLFALAMIAFFLAIALCAIALGFAFNALAIEKIGVFPAISAGFERIFNRREMGRAILIILAFFAVYIGIYIISMLLSGLGMFYLHSFMISMIAGIPVAIVSESFLSVLFAVYYFDVRVRREGLDLQSDLERLNSPALP